MGAAIKFSVKPNKRVFKMKIFNSTGLRSSQRYRESTQTDYVSEGILPSFGVKPRRETRYNPAPMPRRAPVVLRTRVVKNRAIQLLNSLKSIKIRLKTAK